MTSVERVHFYSTKLPQEKNKLDKLPIFSENNSNFDGNII
jgi:hypothetical protein